MRAPIFVAVAAMLACNLNLDLPPSPLYVAPVVHATGFADGTAVVVPPLERVVLVANGGRPPFTWSLAAGAAGTITSGGLYTAGNQGHVTDTVTVTDAKGNQASLQISTGDAIAVDGSQLLAALRSGDDYRLFATGGKPPYFFGFADRGNRTGGTLDPLGQYAPGTNAGSADRFRVMDSLGALAELDGTPVRSERIPVADAVRIAHGDLDGDGRDDLVVLSRDIPGRDAIVTVSLPWGGGVVTHTYRFSSDFGNAVDDFVVADVNGDGHADVVVLDAADGLAHVLLSDRSGALSQDAVIPNTGGVGKVDARFEPNAFPQRGRILLAVGSGPLCASGGIAEIDWPQNSATPGAASCLADGELAAFVSLADLDGDGLDDAVWALVGTLSYLTNGATTPVRLTLPANTTAGLPLYPPSAIVGSADLNGDLFGDVAFMLEDVNGGDALLEVLYGGTTPALGPTADSGATAAALDLARLGPLSAPALALYDGSDRIQLFTATDTAAPPAALAVQPGPLAFGTGAISLADLDGDGYADLTTGRLDLPAISVAPGDGQGQFARFPRREEQGDFALGDFDGDGIADLLSVNSTGAVVVQYASRDEVVQGPVIPASAPLWTGFINSRRVGPFLQLGDLDGDGAKDLVYVSSGSELMFRADAAGKGLFPSATDVTLLDLHSQGGNSFATPCGAGIADFGGSASGPDAWGAIQTTTIVNRFTSTDSAVRLAVRDASGVTTVPALGFHGSCQIAATDLSGDGITDFVAACAGDKSGPGGIYRAIASGKGDAIAYPNGGSPAPLISLPTGTSAVIAGVSGDQVVVVYSDLNGRHLVWMQGSGAPVITDDAAPGAVLGAAAGDVFGQQGLDVVVQNDKGQLTSYQADATHHYQRQQSFLAAGELAGLSPLGGTVANVLMRVPVASGLPSTLLVLKNDGSGGF
jgi:hypothetical protein